MKELEVRKYDYIDAIRGLAILGVVLVHSSQNIKPVSSFFVRLMNEGAAGVQFFYVASAITLCMSWSLRGSSELNPIKNFYMRRFFRIAPLFYTAIFFYIALYGFSPSYWAPNGIDWWFLPVTVLFLHGFHPETINSVVPGGWSIAVEMTFYFLFPFIFKYIKTVLSCAVAIFISLTLQRYNVMLSNALFSYSSENAYILHNFMILNIVSQLPVFLSGVLAYKVIIGKGLLDRDSVFICSFFFLLLMIEFIYPSQSFVPHHVVSGFVFSIFAVFLSFFPLRVFVNGLFVFLGKLSFSIYLVHFSVLHFFRYVGLTDLIEDGNLRSFVFFFIVMLTSVFFSYFTHRFIEIPGINFGRKLIGRWEVKRSRMISTSAFS